MRIMLVYYLMNDGGSAQDVRNYSRVARESGDEIVVYGPERDDGELRCSRDIESADAVVFIFEWTTELRDGDQLDLARIIGKVSRSRRIVVDCDGAYNDVIRVGSDYNHRDEAGSRRWTQVCESLSDRIYQPTLRPKRSNVGTFFFHGYDPDWERPLDFSGKDFGMVYVGHSKFRWWPMYRVLRAVEPVRDRVGRIALIGHGWDSMPSWAGPMQIEDYYYTEPQYLAKMNVEFVSPIGSADVIPWMSRARFNPVIYRPLFSYLGFVTCRTFETPGAGTLPLFGLDPVYVRETFGCDALELVLPTEGATDKIRDMFERPGHYAEVCTAIREHMNRRHSYQVRLQELMKIVKG
jgi:hypothetical protein